MFFKNAKGITGACCVTLLALALSGPPWPHLLVMGVLLLSTRSHLLAILLVILLSSVVAAMYARGLRLISRVDINGRMGLVLIRHGSPVPGLQAGCLLVASRELQHTIFEQSVILIYEHNSQGTRGVILNHPLPDQAAAFSHPEIADPIFTSQYLSHHLGGPVGMPDGRGRPAHEFVVLHSVPAIQGSRLVLLSTTNVDDHTGDDDSQLMSGPVFEGGELTALLHAVLTSRVQYSPLRVYHGISAWAAGQLEGEIRSGSWGFCRGKVEDVVDVLPGDLWQYLSVSDRLSWL